MDGTLDTSSEMWRIGSRAAKPLGLDHSGQIVCPMCAKNVYSEPLRNVAGTELFGCARGHRFSLESIPARSI